MSIENFREREVFGFWLKGDGTPLTGEVIIFNTTADLGYTSENFVAQRDIRSTVAVNGRYSAMLWCDEDSLVPINWNVHFPKDPDKPSAVPPAVKSFSLAFQTGEPIAVGTLLQLGLPAPDDAVLFYQAVHAYILSLIADGTIPTGGGAGGGFTLEQIQDSIAGMLTAGTNASLVYNDPANSLVIGVTGMDLKADKANVIRSTSSNAPTLVTDDVGKEVRCTAAAAKVVSVPSTSSLTETFVCAVLNTGAGALTFSPANNVTIRNNSGALAQYKTATLRAIGTDQYLLTGELA